MILDTCILESLLPFILTINDIFREIKPLLRAQADRSSDKEPTMTILPTVRTRLSPHTTCR